MEVRAAVRAPSNIALIKYWGKSDEDLIIPLNSSLSLTTDIDEVYTHTEVVASPALEGIELRLNGKEDKLTRRIIRLVEEVRKLLPEQQRTWGIRINTHNNFPTAAGMASSASGFAALACALTQAFSLHEQFPGQFSALARLGSGSASRSMYGGVVEWQHGSSHETSIAMQVFEQAHWPELELVLVLISTASKEVSSTSGMKSSADTSMDLQDRINRRVPERLERIKSAIAAKDFPTVATITMTDSDDLHHICETSDPQIVYLTYKSHAVKDVVRSLNAEGVKAGFTFDAGPNAFIVTLRQHRELVLERLLALFKVKNYEEGLNRQAKETISAQKYSELAQTAILEIQGIMSLKVSARGAYRLEN